MAVPGWEMCREGCGLHHKHIDSNPAHDPRWLAEQLASARALLREESDNCLCIMTDIKGAAGANLRQEERCPPDDACWWCRVRAFLKPPPGPCAACSGMGTRFNGGGPRITCETCGGTGGTGRVLLDPRGSGVIESHWVAVNPAAAARPRSAVTSGAPPVDKTTKCSACGTELGGAPLTPPVFCGTCAITPRDEVAAARAAREVPRLKDRAGPGGVAVEVVLEPPPPSPPHRRPRR